MDGNTTGKDGEMTNKIWEPGIILGLLGAQEVIVSWWKIHIGKGNLVKEQ